MPTRIKTLWAAVEAGSDAREQIVEDVLREAIKWREDARATAARGMDASFCRGAAVGCYHGAWVAAGLPGLWPSGVDWFDGAAVPGFDDAKQAAA